jgi:hypothetical protein
MFETVATKTCTVNMAISVIALAADTRCAANVPLDAVQLVQLIEDFCDEVPSKRWKEISEGVVKRLEYWQVIDDTGEIKGLF